MNIMKSIILQKYLYAICIFAMYNAIYVGETSCHINTRIAKHILRKLNFNFLSNQMGYNRGDSFPFDFEQHGISFSSKSKGKLSPQLFPIRYERKLKSSLFFSLRVSLQEQINGPHSKSLNNIIYKIKIWILIIK